MRILRRVLRGPASCALLRRLGIDPKRYWLLVDLFGQLSQRGEMMDQLGQNGVALRIAGCLYGFLTAIMSVAMVLKHTAPDVYLAAFLALTGILLLTVLLSETGNSLVNPTEAHILTHQPIDGSTYVAAKLTHLIRILLYLVPALNGVPAFGGLYLKNTPWFYPFEHLAAAFAVGAIAALLCCATYGWLIRFLPAPRLKAAGQLAAIVPIVAMMWQQHVRSVITGILKVIPVDPAARWALGLLGCAAAIAIAAFGIRSLSGDYLVRVSGIMRGGRAVPVRLRRTARKSLIARLFGGQPGRAGFAFVSRMMLRDFQFRRQALPTVVLGLLGLAGPLLGKWRVDPFSGHFTAMHIVPHAIAFALFFFCILMPFGNDYKGVWIFLTAPGHALKGFSRGVFGSLCVPLIIVPHTLLLPLLAVAWGPLHSALFVAYSVAISFLYLSLELRLIDGPPFCRQVDPTRNATALPMIILGGTVVGVGVAVQLLLVFPSLTRVAIATVVAGAAAWLLTQRSLGALEASIRHNLGVVSEESGTLYREVNM